jgi:hypothetical protein
MGHYFFQEWYVINIWAIYYMSNGYANKTEAYPMCESIMVIKAVLIIDSLKYFDP